MKRLHCATSHRRSSTAIACHGLAVSLAAGREHDSRAVDQLDERFSLDLMLVGSDAWYLAYLRELVDARPRVRLRPLSRRSECRRRRASTTLGCSCSSPRISTTCARCPTILRVHP